MIIAIIISLLVGAALGSVGGYWFCNRKIAEKVKAQVEDKINELKKELKENL